MEPISTLHRHVPEQPQASELEANSGEAQRQLQYNQTRSECFKI